MASRSQYCYQRERDAFAAAGAVHSPPARRPPKQTFQGCVDARVANRTNGRVQKKTLLRLRPHWAQSSAERGRRMHKFQAVWLNCMLWRWRWGCLRGWLVGSWSAGVAGAVFVLSLRMPLTCQITGRRHLS
eukprot:365767-Chlamydomonas_euryale.AAC.9